MSRPHQLLVCTDHVTLFTRQRHRLYEKNAETPLIVSKETDLEVNAEKTKYVPMSHELIAGKKLLHKIR